MDFLDQIFELLSEERRRYALYYLEQENDPVTVDDIAEQVAEWETDGPPESIPDEKYEQIEVELYHHDLPKASEEPYVRYNPESKMVELSGAPPEVDAVIPDRFGIAHPPRLPRTRLRWSGFAQGSHLNHLFIVVGLEFVSKCRNQEDVVVEPLYAAVMSLE